MALFAPVCPTPILEALHSRGTLPPYHLLLAHDIVEHSDIYYRLFHRRPAGMTIILDNSVIELGSAVDIKMIVEAAKIVQPNTTVLPDVLLNSNQTIDSCTAAIHGWSAAFRRAGLTPAFMYVPQGRAFHSWTLCAEALADEPSINFWGIPRNIVQTPMMSRYAHISIARALNPKRYIHLLGFSNNLIDDIVCAHLPDVFGIDSAVPIRAVSQQIPMKIGAFNNMPPRGDWWTTATFHPDMEVNLTRAQQWFRGPYQ